MRGKFDQLLRDCRPLRGDDAVQASSCFCPQPKPMWLSRNFRSCSLTAPRQNRNNRKYDGAVRRGSGFIFRCHGQGLTGAKRQRGSCLLPRWATVTECLSGTVKAVLFATRSSPSGNRVCGCSTRHRGLGRFLNRRSPSENGVASAGTRSN